ncbi:DUF7389 domain-containing protein [Natronoarchaeum rubrum]|uniref:DUF7389 domain-containing protein n=1 Tax=Natronoarchaeum rubrum TaxID=755311 RepID=UPI0021115B48|nr:hypothetical protein [Natronoarchaeum rubrum]
MSDEDHVQRNISESADKIRVETQVKRGSGTRDEDRIKVKVKGDDPDDVVERLNDTIENLHETGDELRELQPGDRDAE